MDALSSELQKLDQRGVTLSLDLYTDFLAGRDSGRRVHTAPMLADLSANVDLKHLTSALSNTTLFTSVHMNHTVAEGFPSPIQSISGIDADGGMHLPEIWVEHAFRASVRVRAGRIDANRDFAFIENGTNFLNATAGFTPTFIALPNYDDTRPGMELLLDGKRVDLNVAAFTPNEGTGALLMEEAGSSWNPQGWHGRISAGYWRVTGRLSTVDGFPRTGASGLYAVAEQKLWRRRRVERNVEQSVSAYLQWGQSAGRFSDMPRQNAVGFLWNAPFALRGGDAAGFSWSNGLAIEGYPLPSRTETAWEAFYCIRVSKWFSFTPDLQYVVGPLGTGEPRSAYSIGSRFALNLHSGSG